jgi:NADH-quinone oxidoreductase subunit I
MLRCIFCGLCEDACPKDAIYLSETFAPANFTRKGFIYAKNDLLIPNPKTEAAAFAAAKGVEA